MKMVRKVVDGVKRFRCDERGDVLMEYVLVTVVIVLPMVGAATYIYNPSGVTFDLEGALGGEDFGILGNMFVDLYRMVMSGLSLPLP
jgi:Flp pilus assembly pilin Flp